MRTLSYLFVALCVAALSTSAAIGHAQDARERFRRGSTAYQQGDYETAIREWSAAYTADPRPLIQYNLSQAYERNGQLVEARTALETYLSGAAANDPNQADARARVAALRERLARTGVRITGGPAGAEILIDGRDWGRTPRPDLIALEPGSHRIVIRLAGHADFNSSVSVPAGQSVEVPVEMTAQSGTPSNTNPNTNPSTTTPTDPGTSAPPGSSAPARDFPVGPVVVTSVGGVAAITGLVLGIMAKGNADSAPTSNGPEANDARSLAMIADICLFGGLAVAAGGLVWLIVDQSSGPSQPSTTSDTGRARPGSTFVVAPIVSPTVFGLGASGTF